jgi:ribose/xylose/arabinose/galactoside ABC-type transport system permease subunit
VLLGVNSYAQYVANGVIVLLAVLISGFRPRIGRRTLIGSSRK